MGNGDQRIKFTDGRMCLRDGRAVLCSCEGEPDCCDCGRLCDFTTSKFSVALVGIFDVRYTIFGPDGQAEFEWDWPGFGGQSSAEAPAGGNGCQIATNGDLVLYLGRAADTIRRFQELPDLIGLPGGSPGSSPPRPGLPDITPPQSVAVADAALAARLLYDAASGWWFIRLAFEIAYNNSARKTIEITGEIPPADVDAIEGNCIVDPDVAVHMRLLPPTGSGVATVDIPISIAQGGQGLDGIQLGFTLPAATYLFAFAGGRSGRLSIRSSQNYRFGLSGVSRCDPSQAAPGPCCQDVNLSNPCRMGACGPTVGVDFVASYIEHYGYENRDVVTGRTSVFRDSRHLLVSGRALRAPGSCTAAHARINPATGEAVGTLNVDAEAVTSIVGHGGSAGDVNETFRLDELFGERNAAVFLGDGPPAIVQMAANANVRATFIGAGGPFVLTQAIPLGLTVSADNTLPPPGISGFFTALLNSFLLDPDGTYTVPDGSDGGGTYTYTVKRTADYGCPGTLRGSVSVSYSGIHPASPNTGQDVYSTDHATGVITIAITGWTPCQETPEGELIGAPRASSGCAGCGHGGGLVGVPA